MSLTDVAVRQAKAAAKPYKMTDSGGLFLLVNKTGSKLWRLKYRFGGKEKLISCGKYPDVSLAEARETRDASKKLLSHGIDPSNQRLQDRLATAAAASNTFGLIAKEFIAKLEAEGRADRTINKTRWMLEDLLGVLADRPITQITAQELLQVLRRIEARGVNESTQRCRATASRVFRFAIATARAENDPTVALAGALVTPKVTHRAAITAPDKVGAMLRAIDDMDGSLVVRRALQIMALCFPRPGELRTARWSNIDFDAKIWTIPAEHAKMKRPHSIPLPAQAIAIFTALKAATGHRELVFPGIRSPKLPLSENTLNAALRRLGYASDEMTSHGFRTVASTLLNESGLWHPDAIERALAHLDANAVRRAYARGEYWDERVRMATWWAEHLDALKAGKKVAAAKPESPKPADVVGDPVESKPKKPVRSRTTEASKQLNLF